MFHCILSTQKLECQSCNNLVARRCRECIIYNRLMCHKCHHKIRKLISDYLLLCYMTNDRLDVYKELILNNIFDNLKSIRIWIHERLLLIPKNIQEEFINLLGHGDSNKKLISKEFLMISHLQHTPRQEKPILYHPYMSKLSKLNPLVLEKISWDFIDVNNIMVMAYNYIFNNFIVPHEVTYKYFLMSKLDIPRDVINCLYQYTFYHNLMIIADDKQFFSFPYASMTYHEPLEYHCLNIMPTTFCSPLYIHKNNNNICITNIKPKQRYYKLSSKLMKGTL
jgi:hypothetical protein